MSDSVNCWLENFCVQRQISLPRFSLGQYVEVRWELDNGTIEVREGRIVGLFPHDSTHYIRGWWYLILFDETIHSWLNPDYVDECHEEELVLLDSV